MYSLGLEKEPAFFSSVVGRLCVCFVVFKILLKYTALRYEI